MRLPNNRFGMLCSIPGLIGLVLLILYPTLYNVFVSFLKYDNRSPIVFHGFNNFKWLLRSGDFLVSLKVSTIYSLSSTMIALVVGFTIAYCLFRIKRFVTLFRILVVLPWAIPLVISGLMWKWILNMDIGVANYFLTSLGLIKENLPFLADSQLAMLSGIIATGWVYIPFATVFILAGLESISSDLFEAARVDGADAVQQIGYIAIPLIRRPIGIIFIIIVMFTFRTPAVFFALTRGGPGKATYHLGLFLKDSIFSFLNFGHGAAVGVFITFILIIFTIPYFYLLFKKAE